jgi:hypothetical protein
MVDSEVYFSGLNSVYSSHYRCTKTNCNERIDAWERFSLEAVCSTCSEKSIYTWRVDSDKDKNLTDTIWLRAMEFNRTGKLLAIKEEYLPVDSSITYTFTVTGKIFGNLYSHLGHRDLPVYRQPDNY